MVNYGKRQIFKKNFHFLYRFKKNKKFYFKGIKYGVGAWPLKA